MLKILLMSAIALFVSQCDSENTDNNRDDDTARDTCVEGKEFDGIQAAIKTTCDAADCHNEGDPGDTTLFLFKNDAAKSEQNLTAKGYNTGTGLLEKLDGTTTDPKHTGDVLVPDIITKADIECWTKKGS